MIAWVVAFAVLALLAFRVIHPPLPELVTDLHGNSSSRTSPTTFDYIVVGGGTAGNVVASLLSDDPDASVLLVEAGPYTSTSPVSLPSIPGLTALNVGSKLQDW